MEQLWALPESFQVSNLEWAFAFFAAFLTGIIKSGLKGISVIIVVSLALAFGSKASTGILVPLLILGDIFAVIYYKKHTQWKYLFKLMPWMMMGIVLGAWIGKDLPEQLFKQGMIVIILISVAMMFLWDRKEREVPNQWWFAGTIGTLAGFTTMIGNLAGAFSNIFFLAMKLPKNQFIGTAAWLFLCMNLFKLPFHIFVWGTITQDTLLLDARLAIFVLLGLGVGIKLIAQIKSYYYRKMILVLTGIGAILLFFK